MSTNANIGIIEPDGTVTAIYTHWDGYPSHHGPILLEHYTDEAKVRALIALGDISSLGPEIGEPHDFDTRDHSVCTAYHRDRQEPWADVKPTKVASVGEFLQGLGHAEYLYLWRHGRWEFSASRKYNEASQLRELTPVDCKERDA